MTRAVDIGMALPSLEQLYRGARSIYSGAFETDDFGLRLRWSSIEQQWGYPHNLTHEGPRAINQFAEAKLGAMIVNGRLGANPTLPLTETQRARAKGEKEAEKKRSAAARLSTSPTEVAAGVMVNGTMYSSTTSSRAQPCTQWRDKGACPRGISCWFRHDGFPTHGANGGLIN
eukprot:6272350-Pyramimonas_sp.AAC.1